LTGTFRRGAASAAMVMVLVMTVNRPSRPRPDLRERFAGRLFHVVNPLARRMIPAGVPTGAPNIVLIVRGRRSGIERTTPVGMLDFDGRWYVQASYGATGWARNLRAAGEATVIHPGGRRSPVHAVQVPPDEAGSILRRALEPYHQSHLLRRLLGPRVRPPVALLRRHRVRVDDTPQEYLAEAQRHPLFELRAT
jgi:deazaflavin-dependent oxidoreductase (nitroreductase family)